MTGKGSDTHSADTTIAQSLDRAAMADLARSVLRQREGSTLTQLLARCLLRVIGGTL